jgi:hypothetical protein
MEGNGSIHKVAQQLLVNRGILELGLAQDQILGTARLVQHVHQSHTLGGDQQFLGRGPFEDGHMPIDDGEIRQAPFVIGAHDRIGRPVDERTHLIRQLIGRGIELGILGSHKDVQSGRAGNRGKQGNS